MAKAQPADTTPTSDPAAAAVEDKFEVLAAGHEDGKVTFTRPGIESRDFTVKDGKISTTKEGQDWLLTHALGTGPVAE